MKRILLIALTAALMVFLMSSVALAAGYRTYDGTNPHGGYTGTSNKCKICHAVHDAASGGEVLLRSTVANACVYCHISPGYSTKTPYGSTTTNYTSDVRWNHSSVGYALIGNTHAANSFGIGSEESQCVDCHSVHGANAITIGQTTIAKKDPGVSGGTTVENENTFCNNCHSLKHTATTSYNTTSHVQKAAGASYGNVPPATYSGRVAWADSTDCSSCHYIGDGTDRNYTTPVKNFPHITQDATNPTTNGVWQFLDTDYQSTNVAYTDPDSSLSNFDNICMRCHTSNNSYSPTVSTLGAVGYTF